MHLRKSQYLPIRREPDVLEAWDPNGEAMHELVQEEVKDMVDAEGDGPLWYAIRVRQKVQFEVDRLLQSKGVESFAPSVMEVRRWSDRSMNIRVALFQGYSFVRILWGKNEMLTVLRTPGVIGFVPGNGTRAPSGTERSRP